MRPLLCLSLLLLGLCSLRAQTLAIHVSDSISHEALVGASVRTRSGGAATDADGWACLRALPLGPQTLRISYLGYQDNVLNINFLAKNDTVRVRLVPAGEAIEELTISTTRTNSRIEDLPVKVEVLGAEELDEEVSLVPGGMGSLLGDLSVITIQRTGPVSGNDAVRMQGLAPGYTQLLQDGLPLYGGFSGSLGVLNIPPLDLQQVEIIKGSSSTLYGGGAIGGLINFISKTPAATPAATLLLNQTTLGETNAHAYLSRRFGGAQGFTLLAAATRRPARDLNHDGFAEIAQTAPLMLHPRWFFGLGKKTGGDLGVNFSQNHLRGGDQAAIRENQASAEHPFYQRERIQRFTAHGQIHTLLSPTATWTLRGAGSAFGRSGMYAGLDFAGRQLNTYLETNVLWHVRQTDAVLGGSLTTEHFDLRHSAPTVAFGDFGQQTAGVFAQLDRRFSQKVALQLGLRTDHSSRYGWFVLPRASLLYRPGAQLSARLGYGRGYKAPDLFAATEPSDFTRLLPLSASIRPDLAHSLNLDLNYRLLLFEALSLQFNQAFYYVHLTAPFVLQRDAAGAIFLENAHATGQVLGTDSYLQLRYAAWELYLGYNHTQSERRATDRSKSPEPFNPQDKVAATLAWSLAPHWRFGLEAAWTGRQYGNGGEGYPTFWFFAGMVARQFNWGRVVLNCENLGDARQARHAPLVTGSRLAPAFAPLWGPVEGRVVNLSVKLDL